MAGKVAATTIHPIIHDATKTNNRNQQTERF
jgi:hypothetical protein